MFSGQTSDPFFFTGKERDAESGLDYFGARYYSSNMGRWMSPDWAAKPEAVPYSSLDNPQSLNLYGYVGNNPLSRVDADGHDCCDAADAYSAVVTLMKIGDVLSSAFNSFVKQGAAAISDRTGRSQGLIAAGMIAESAVPVPSMEGVGTSGATNVGVTEGTEAATGMSQVQINAANGRAFQNAVAAETAVTDTGVVQNLSVRTQSGVRTQIDIASRNPTNAVRLQETKASATASLTKNQRAGHPEIANYGATVIGKGKPGFPGGTKIPPTKVEVVRPKEN